MKAQIEWERCLMSDTTHTDVLQLTTTIVSAHIAGNDMATDELPAFIQVVYAALRQAPEAPQTDEARADRQRQEPAVPVKQSVFPDYIVCLEDGKKMKMLRRHLTARYGMTVAEYRTKWGLPLSYPVVAPNYATKRSELAKQIGLGRKQSEPDAEPQIQRIPEGKSGQRRQRANKAA